MDAATQLALISSAQARGYLSFPSADRIVYHCHRRHEEDYTDPEEAIRAATYSWLILEREYAPSRIEVEVPVPRRVPNDRADTVVYEDDQCRVPYLVVENKPRRVSALEVARGVEQGYGNANSLRARYMLFDNADSSLLFDVANFGAMERVANMLGPRDALARDYGRPRAFRLVAGATPGVDEIAAVSSRDLETAVRKAHGLIWAGGARDPLLAFQEWCKLLFAKVHDERWAPTGSPRGFQVGAGENEVSVGNRVRTLYAAAQRGDPTVWPDPIALPDAKIRDVVVAIQDISLLTMNVDALGEAFERFFGTIFRGGLGQYFTRRELVRFTVALLRPTHEDLVLDPTAGSGGFLLETLVQVWHEIERRYAGRPDVDRLRTDFALNHLFGIELHNVVGRVCQTNLLVHHDGHTNVEVGRSALDRVFSNPEIRLGRYSLVVGNPPFGDQVKDGDVDRLGTARLTDFVLPRTDQADSELVILERSMSFLEPGGRLGMVVPDGLLNNSGEGSRCPAFRRFLLRNAVLLAIVSLPDYAFRKAGAQNKTSLLFWRKFMAAEHATFTARLHELARDAGVDEALLDGLGPELDPILAQVLTELDHPVFLAEAEWIGYSPAGATIARNDLYSLIGHEPDRNNLSTLLGQYALFEANPAAYPGSIAPAAIGMSASALFAAHPSHRMDPKYHIFKVREVVTAVPAGMTRYRLGNVLTRAVRPVKPADYPTEQFVTLTLSQEGGLEPREAGKGNNPVDWLGAYFEPDARWFRARDGDLIISRIDVWKGCVAIIPPEFTDAIVTQEFPLYSVDEALLRPYYLKLLLRTDYFQRAMRAITTGHSNRRRTQDTDFENLEIFLPDTGTQDAVAALVRGHEQEAGAARSALRSLIGQVEKCVMGLLPAAALLAAPETDGNGAGALPQQGDAPQVELGAPDVT